MLNIGDNFNYQGQKPNFARDTFETKSAMKNYPAASIDEGHISLCLEDGKRYKYSASNSNDATLGKWRLCVDTALSTTSENPVQNKVIQTQFTNLQNTFQQQLAQAGNTANQAIGAVQNDLNNTKKISAAGIEAVNNDLQTTKEIISTVLEDLNLHKISTETEINGHKLTGNISLTKNDVGLGAVDNTSDANKPVSNATQNALDKKVDKVEGSRLITSSEASKLTNLPNNLELQARLDDKADKATTVNGKALSSNVVLTGDDIKTGTGEEDPTLNEAFVTKTTTVNGKSLRQNVTLEAGDVGLGNVDNTSDIDKPVSTAQQNAIDAKAREIGQMTAAAIEDLEQKIEDSNEITAEVLQDLQNHVSESLGGGGSVGSSTQPTYVSDGVLVPIEHTIESDVPAGAIFTDTTYVNATQEAAGLMSTSDKTKLDGIESGAQVNSITGVKGESEASYRTGQVNITKANLGLGSVETLVLEGKVGEELDKKVDKIDGSSLMTEAEHTKLSGIASGAQVNTITGVKGNSESVYRTGDVNITKANIGLGNVDNTSDSNKPVSTATQTALNGKVDKATTVNGHALSGNVSVTKSDVGLGNCDNTSDQDKPISTAQETEFTKVKEISAAGIESLKEELNDLSSITGEVLTQMQHQIRQFCPIIVLTQAEYDALPSKQSNTLYLICN